MISQMTMKPVNHPNQVGFTLIEVMVALFIIALLAGSALALLRVSVDGENVAREKSSEQATLRRFATILRQDMAHILPRPSRDDRGNVLPSFYVQGEVIAGFVRNGVQRVDGTGGADVQRIEYRYNDGRLSRFVYDYLDGSDRGRETVLFDDFASVDMRYRVDNGVWQDAWRVERLADQPIAIEMQIKQPARPDLRLVVPLGRGYQL